MHLAPPPSDGCGHPNADEGTGKCAACHLRERHDGQAKAWNKSRLGPDGRCDCSLCAFLDSLEQESDADRLEALCVWADVAVEEAADLYFAAGKEIEDLIAFIREWDLVPLEVPPKGYYPHEHEKRLQQLAGMRYDAYLTTPEWREHRRRAVKRAGGRCQGCNASEHLEVHHRTYEGGRGQEAAGDLTVLCAACHTAVHLVADGRRGKIRDKSRRPRR